MIVDNMGALFSAEHVIISQRAKTIDMKLFVREYAQGKLIRASLVETDGCHAGVFTKDKQNNLNDKHVKHMVKSKNGVQGTTGRVLESAASEHTKNNAERVNL